MRTSTTHPQGAHLRAIPPARRRRGLRRASGPCYWVRRRGSTSPTVHTGRAKPKSSCAWPGITPRPPGASWRDSTSGTPMRPERRTAQNQSAIGGHRPRREPRTSAQRRRPPRAMPPEASSAVINNRWASPGPVRFTLAPKGQPDWRGDWAVAALGQHPVDGAGSRPGAGRSLISSTEHPTDRRCSRPDGVQLMDGQSLSGRVPVDRPRTAHRIGIRITHGRPKGVPPVVRPPDDEGPIIQARLSASRGNVIYRPSHANHDSPANRGPCGDNK